MRKTFYTLSLAAALVAHAPAYAADLTTQQKYDALAAKGIFAGIDGEAALDRNLNRAQFARVAALILGLDGIGANDTKVVTEKPFSDVQLGTWYVEEVAAAKEAGILAGNADATFNPRGDVTVQELAVLTARQLGLTPVQDAKVPGAADWAAGYIRAVQNAGLVFSTNYTGVATRGDLTALVLTANPQTYIPTQAEIAAQVIRDAVKANPDQATAIVRDAIKADPTQAALITKAAVAAAPDKAGDITGAALAAAPEQTDAILKAALDAAPEQAAAINTAAKAASQAADSVASNPATSINNSSVPGDNGGSGGGDPVASPSR